MGVNLMIIRLFYKIISVSFAMQLVFGKVSVKSERGIKTFAHPAASLEVPTFISDMYGKCGRKHFVRVSEYKKHARGPRRTFEKLAKLLNVIRHPNMNHVKRNVPTEDHVVKCMQRTDGTVTCFCRGKFYLFKGGEKVQFREAAINHKLKRYCSNCAPRPKFSLSESTASNTSLQTKKLSSQYRVSPFHGNPAPYQEVMIEPNSRKGRPISCYGFVAPPPNAIYSKKASSAERYTMFSQSVNPVSKSVVNSCQHKRAKDGTSIFATPRVHSGRSSNIKMPSGSELIRNSGFRKQKCSPRMHLLRKRSQIVSVACRPLYVPTAKPSVNEGRVPQCRIPCGPHNCPPYPTCPCRPPCRTKAPPLTTCPPIPGLECEATLNPPTRCPPYEFTDEPCPTFECKDGCPYLTTPGCPASSDKVNRGRKGQSTSEGNKVSSVGRASTEISTNRMITRISSSTVMTRNMSMTMNKTIEGHTSEASSSKVTGPKPVDVPRLWSNLDFKKLLNAAKSHYTQRVELNPRYHRNEVPIN